MLVAARHRALLGVCGLVVVFGAHGCTRKQDQPLSADPVPASARRSVEAQPRLSRAGHTVSTLTDGSVLVVGGTYALATADSFVWEPPGKTTPIAMTPRREGHTATALADGGVLIAGGTIARHDEPRSGGRMSLRACALFDAKRREVTPTGSLQFDRAQHTATRLADGRVLVAGGSLRETSADRQTRADSLASAELWDPATGQWTRTGDLHEPRWGHRAERLRDGRVLVTGGFGKSGTLATVELWDPTSGAWTQARPMKLARSGHVSKLLADGRLLVIGGRAPTEVVTPGGGKTPHIVGTASTELYDPVKDEWTSGPPLSVPRSEPAFVELEDGSLVVMGGLSAPENPANFFVEIDKSRALPTSERWVAGTARFEPVASYSLAHARTQAVAVVLRTGRVLVVGGLSDDGPEWELVPAATTRR